MKKTLLFILVGAISVNFYLFGIQLVRTPNCPINNSEYKQQSIHKVELQLKNKTTTQNDDDDNKYDKFKTTKSYFIQQMNLALLKVNSHLASAHRYARSGITMQQINSAYSIIQNILLNNSETVNQLKNSINSSSYSTDKLPDQEEEEECPEIYVEDKKDFQVLPCNKKALNEIISLLFLFPDCKSGVAVLNGIPQHYKNLSIRVGVQKRETLLSSSCDSLLSSGTAQQLTDFQLIDSEVSNNAEGWKALLRRVNTKYVLIGRDLDSFNNQASIERLIRVLSVTGVEAIGGSERYADGRWSAGCYQMSMKNYTLRLVQGYDQSFSSCLYCDYLSTAFVTRRDNLIEKLSSSAGNLLFVDYFMELFRADKIGAMSCPDVMFSTLSSNQLNEMSRDSWQSIATKWKLNRIVLPNERDIWFNCHEVKIVCTLYTNKAKGEIVPPCCLEILRNEVLRMMKIFKDNGVYMELFEGTLIGAVKFSSTLPWEVDADFIYSVDDKQKEFAALLNTYFRHEGYPITLISDNRYTINFANWFAEWFGHHNLNDTPERRLFANSTKVLFDGVWLNSPPNPALSLRKYYGDDIFQHVEHWRPLFNNQYFNNWTQIKRGYFQSCEEWNFHGCLSDNYLPAGNLQFRDIWV